MPTIFSDGHLHRGVLNANASDVCVHRERIAFRIRLAPRAGEIINTNASGDTIGIRIKIEKRESRPPDGGRLSVRKRRKGDQLWGAGGGGDAERARRSAMN